jgi:hypothetical protein
MKVARGSWLFIQIASFDREIGSMYGFLNEMDSIRLSMGHFSTQKLNANHITCDLSQLSRSLRHLGSMTGSR